MEYVATNGLRVHILDPRLFRIMHVMEQIPWFERHDSLVSHFFSILLSPFVAVASLDVQLMHKYVGNRFITPPVQMTD